MFKSEGRTDDIPKNTLSLKVVFSFFAMGIIAILGAGAVLMGFVSTLTNGINNSASAEAAGFAVLFLVVAVILVLAKALS